MLVEVTVENEGVRRRQRAARADQAIGWTLSLSELLKDCMLVAEPEDAMHSFAIDPGWKAAQFRKGPAASEIGVVALIELKPADAKVQQRFAVIVAKDFASLFPGKIRDKTPPHAVVARMRR